MVLAAALTATLTVSSLPAECTSRPNISESLYAKSAAVVELDTAANLVLVEDLNGFRWEFYGCEDFESGDLVDMVMWDHGTSSIMDDVILNVRYSGNIT